MPKTKYNKAIVRIVVTLANSPVQWQEDMANPSISDKNSEALKLVTFASGLVALVAATAAAAKAFAFNPSSASGSAAAAAKAFAFNSSSASASASNPSSSSGSRLILWEAQRSGAKSAIKMGCSPALQAYSAVPLRPQSR